MGARILVIEDEPANMYLIEYLLRSYGHEVLTATTGAEGLERAAADRPDAILCDVQMPGMDGYEVIAHLRSDPELSSSLVLAVTAYATSNDRRKLLAAGFDDYISKPIAPDTFVHEVEQLLGPHLQGSVPSGHARSPVGPGQKGRQRARRPDVLLVDDTPSNLSLMRTIFESAGYDVASASTIATALEVASRDRPSVIVSDVRMPDGGGFELLRRLREWHPPLDIPVLLTTATEIPHVAEQEAMRLGSVDFITRPIDAGDLVRRVQAYLPPTAARRAR